MKKKETIQFVIIPENWKAGRKTPVEILAELRAMTRESFYRMAEAVGVDLELLRESGYEFEGLSAAAVDELKTRLSKRQFDEACRIIGWDDYYREDDFKYVYSLYAGAGHEAGQEPMPSERALVELFINEFQDDKTAARKEILKKYGSRFIAMPELDSFLGSRGFFGWYKGDMIPFDDNDDYIGGVEEAKIVKELIALFKVLITGDGMQVHSTRIKSNKVAISPKATERVADILATALDAYYASEHLPLNEKDAECNPVRDFTWGLLKDARYGEGGESFDLEKISEEVDVKIEGFDNELDLDLFYYLADAAIKWPAGMKLTDRYIFLFRLAAFFKFVSQKDYDATMNISGRKEISDAIKFKIKRVREKDEDKEILKLYLDL